MATSAVIGSRNVARPTARARRTLRTRAARRSSRASSFFGSLAAGMAAIRRDGDWVILTEVEGSGQGGVTEGWRRSRIFFGCDIERHFATSGRPGAEPRHPNPIMSGDFAEK